MRADWFVGAFATILGFAVLPGALVWGAWYIFSGKAERRRPTTRTD